MWLYYATDVLPSLQMKDQMRSCSAIACFLFVFCSQNNDAVIRYFPAICWSLATTKTLRGKNRKLENRQNQVQLQLSCTEMALNLIPKASQWDK